MNEKIRQHYKELYLKHGESPFSVQYSDKKSQYNRFKILSEIDINMNSVLDFGCGLADFYEYIRENLNFNGKYIGIDFVTEFIERNKKKYVNDNHAEFFEYNISKDNFEHKCDYAILSGVFNNKTDNNEEFMFYTIKKMFDLCNKGIAFNAMSTYVDYFDENLYYVDPLKVFDFCKRNLTRRVVLRHDYVVKENSIPFEFCMYLYK